MAFTAAAIGGAALIGGITSMIGSSQAASAQKKAADLAQQRYLQTRSDLQPYTQAGQNVLDPLTGLATSGPTGGGPDYVAQAAANVPLRMSQAELEQTPGYQFTRDQGLKAVASTNAARGLGVSGAALKGAAAYTTGLADKTYTDQFKMAQDRFTDYLNLNVGQQEQLKNQFARLQGTAVIGENAAAQTGTTGANLASTAGNYLNQAGLSTAAGTTGVGSAVTGGVQNYLTNQLMQQYLDRSSGLSGYGYSINDLRQFG